MLLNDRYKIKTETGYKNFLGIQISPEKSGLAIIFNNCYLVCTKNHRIKKDGEFTTADTLKIHDVINSHEIIDIYPCKSKFYDIVLSDNNTYSSEGFEHHNCNIVVVDETAFLKTSLWNDFVDSIMPSQSALAWKKNIFLSTANGINHFKDMCEGAQINKKYQDLSDDTQIELKDGSIVLLKDYYREHYGNKSKQQNN